VSKYEELMKTVHKDEPPKDTIPGGDWVLRCQSAKETENEEYNPKDEDNEHVSVVKLSHVPVEPHGNYDASAIEAGDWRGVPLFTTRYIKTTRDEYEVRQTIKGHGISMEDRTLVEGLGLVRGRSSLVTVGLKTIKRRDGNTAIINTLTNFRPVE